jgi:hypothetical protein
MASCHPTVSTSCSRLLNTTWPQMLAPAPTEPAMAPQLAAAPTTKRISVLLPTPCVPGQCCLAPLPDGSRIRFVAPPNAFAGGRVDIEVAVSSAPPALAATPSPPTPATASAPAPVSETLHAPPAPAAPAQQVGELPAASRTSARKQAQAAQPLPLAAPSDPSLSARAPRAPVELVHGDCVAGMRALPAASVDLVIADPPYNIGVGGSAWDTVPDYMAWSQTWLSAAVAALRPGGALFIYGSPAKLWICHLKLLAASLGLEFKQHISWVYKQGGDSRLTGMSAYSVRTRAKLVSRRGQRAPKHTHGRTFTRVARVPSHPMPTDAMACHLAGAHGAPRVVRQTGRVAHLQRRRRRRAVH